MKRWAHNGRVRVYESARLTAFTADSDSALNFWLLYIFDQTLAFRASYYHEFVICYQNFLGFCGFRTLINEYGFNLQPHGRSSYRHLNIVIDVMKMIFTFCADYYYHLSFIFFSGGNCHEWLRGILFNNKKIREIFNLMDSVGDINYH